MRPFFWVGAGAIASHHESGIQGSIKPRTLKGGAFADEARLRGLKSKTTFHTRIASHHESGSQKLF